MHLDFPAPRVMIVDDEPMVRQLILSVLSGSGYEVADAGSPDQAIRLMDADPNLDLLVTDVAMPDCDGWELAERMRTRKPGLPVLFMSGYEPPNGKTTPNECFLQKPFRIQELLERVRLMLAPDLSTSCSSALPAVAGTPSLRTLS